MGRASSSFNFSLDGLSNNVTCQEFRRSSNGCKFATHDFFDPLVGFFNGFRMVTLEHLWDIVEHETVTLAVGQATTFATNTLSDEDTTYRWRPNHTCWVELNEFHVTKFSTCPQSESMAITRVFPGTGTNAPASCATTCCKNDGLCGKGVEVTIDTGVSDATSNTVTLFQEVTYGVFHEDVNAFVNASLLECTDDFEPCSVTNVSESRESMATKVALIDQEFWCSIEDSAPLFEFSDSIWCFLSMEFSHAPVCEPFASFHGVMEVNLPAVSRVGVGECCGTTALGHDRVCFPEQRFGDDGRFRTASCGFDGGTQSGPTRTDDDHIVFVVGNVLVHRLTSNGKEHHVVQPPLCDQQDPDVAEEYKG